MKKYKKIFKEETISTWENLIDNISSHKGSVNLIEEFKNNTILLLIDGILKRNTNDQINLVFKNKGSYTIYKRLIKRITSEMVSGYMADKIYFIDGRILYVSYTV